MNKEKVKDMDSISLMDIFGTSRVTYSNPFGIISTPTEDESLNQHDDDIDTLIEILKTYPSLQYMICPFRTQIDHLMIYQFTCVYSSLHHALRYICIKGIQNATLLKNGNYYRTEDHKKSIYYQENYLIHLLHLVSGMDITFIDIIVLLFKKCVFEPKKRFMISSGYPSFIDPETTLGKEIIQVAKQTFPKWKWYHRLTFFAALYQLETYVKNEPFHPLKSTEKLKDWVNQFTIQTFHKRANEPLGVLFFTTWEPVFDDEDAW